METACELRFTRTLAAPTAEVFRSFTHATALRDWLSQSAHTQPQVNGYFLLQWPDLSIVQGIYQKFEPPHLLEFSWQPLGDAKPDKVEIHIEPVESGSQLTLVHHLAEDCDSARQVYTAAWESALENLASFLQTGIDLRLARRPRMGIYLDNLNAAVAARLGVPVNEGVLIEGTAPGSGAERSGLCKEDVLISLDGQPTPVATSLAPILQKHKAGDQLKIEFYRGAELVTAELELSSFPIPEFPQTAADLAAAAHQGFDGVIKGIREITTGLPDAQASHRPAENEWSVKELVVHFILCERDYQSWAANMLLDHPINDDIEMRPNVNERITAVVDRFGSLEALALLAGLPEPFVLWRKHLYRRLADWALNVVPGHFNEGHLQQFLDTIEKAKG
jgi:uncharacterized protein YndB with AHSA1/START domain